MGLGMLNILSRVKRRFFRKFRYYETAIDGNYRESEHVEKIGKTIVEEIKKEYPEEFTNRKYQIFMNRYANENDHGYVIRKDGKIASYGWIGINHFYEGTSGYSSDLDSDTCYLYDLYTFEEFKRQGLMEELVQALFALYKTKGFKYMHTIVSTDNIGSNRLMSKFDFEAIGLISVKYFNKKKYIKFCQLK